MRLDRNLQLCILHALADAHPAGVYFGDSLRGTMEADRDTLISNVTYLAEHGLVRSGFRRVDLAGFAGQSEAEETMITAAGMDFLADDGGLSAILGVVTIRLHDDTIRELIALRIQSSDLPAPDKHRLLDQLRALRGESIKHLTMKLLDAGLDNWPKALPLVQKALESFG